MTQNHNQSPNPNEPSEFAYRVARFVGRFIPQSFKDEVKEGLNQARGVAPEGPMPKGGQTDGEKARATAAQRSQRSGTEKPKTEGSGLSGKQRYEFAVLAQTIWDTAYKPEVTLGRESQKLRGSGASSGKISSFVDFYVGEANDILHAETRPVIIAEEMRSTFKGHGEQCSHCNQTFYGASSKIVGAKKSKDLTITADRFRGIADESTVKIAEDAAPEDVLVVEFTDMDRHLLADHHQTDESLGVVKKLFALQPFIFDGKVELEQPRYMTPDQHR